MYSVNSVFENIITPYIFVLPVPSCTHISFLTVLDCLHYVILYRHKDEVLSCLGFCGADIQTASVMFSMQVDTSEEAEKVAARLRQKVVGMPLKNSIAFMFACVGRGEYHYGLPSVESSAFRKYFPDTPLLGLFGNGETGYEFPIEGDVGDIPRMFHAYTTAVVLLCLP